MKKIIPTLICSLAIIALGCTTPEKKTDENATEPIAEYALSVDSARIYIARYDTVFQKHFNGNVPVKAFTIRAADLLEALGVSPKDTVKFHHARIYIGMDFSNKFRLFLTPVEGAKIDENLPGRDVILNGPYSKGSGKTKDFQVSQGEYVMDFTMPCPNSCPNGAL